MSEEELKDKELKVEKKKKKGGNKAVIVIIFILLCTITTLGAVCVKLYRETQKEKQVEANKEKIAGSSIVVTDDGRDYVSEIKKITQANMINVRMTQNWVFEQGGATSNAYLANSERNTFDMRFVMTIRATGEEIMVSPIVPVGSCIENFPLSKYLEPGKYEVIIAHQKVVDEEVASQVQTVATITVVDE